MFLDHLAREFEYVQYVETSNLGIVLDIHHAGLNAEC